VVIETCIKYPGGPTRIRGADIYIDIIQYSIIYCALVLVVYYIWLLLKLI
jgi:hypothetical protein